MNGTGDPAQPPHGLMGLQPRAPAWGTYGLLLVIVLLSLFLVWRAWCWWKNRQRLDPRERDHGVPVLVDPWSKLRETRDHLLVSEPWTRDVCEDFFFRLSFLLRQALELRTGLPVTGQTLAEMRGTLQKNAALSANFQQELLEFLELAEQLKFAGQWLEAGEARAYQQEVNGWMDRMQNGVL